MDTEINKHYWALMNGRLVVVLKNGKDSYSVCGDWEYDVYDKELEILSEIEKPAGELYYES